MRRSGVLMPISALPSKYGIGTFSMSAYEFVDKLAKAGQSYWQILPLGPTGYGDSPYQSFSTFAGNPYYIDLDEFIRKNWLSAKECDKLSQKGNLTKINYEWLYFHRTVLLRKAFANSKISEDKQFQVFVKENAFWIDDYALYMAIKNSYDGQSFAEWDQAIKTRQPEAIAKYQKEYAEDILFYQFQQYYFAKQWNELKTYANKKGIEIIGDIPIYVAYDSADTWANPELFMLEKDSTPTAVAGCPPDAFSATGQLWGNPLYDWDYHKKTKYEWWMKRLRYCFTWYDVVRIDHFRAFDQYYSIPFGDETAEFGHWEDGPGYDFFEVMKDKLGECKVIAEDLGFLTETVLELVAKTGYPGMKILQFAFDSREESDYLPHNYEKNCVVYTGTHDNDTTKSWYKTISGKDRKFANVYLDLEKPSDVVLPFIRAAMASVADTAIIPMQDYLRLGKEARINWPSTLGGNWEWRMKEGAFDKDCMKEMYTLTKLYGRIQK